ncbi:alkene reductase [Amycolatopsis jiangsuensis]|uniref:N-ethylmaleimide reductase n=1 Tax=Amycolatopsis jiangsuensis TaxID=1181879 RepID=A0A840J841_9PSEU|nr:alkene reductase [Amycolatopsis jiangsuensis]MBB4689592.1 N-ethylmaleimide reductase [Amycolatopsis jiangsuensis]
MASPFDPVKIGDIELKNRIAMAPMTRSRAYGPDHSPTELTAQYYAQRASAGVIVTESTQPNAIGQGYPNTPGLHNETQIAAWRRVTDAVHAQGGRIFAQLMHGGRVGHPSNTDERFTPVAPSPVRAAGQIFTASGMQDFPVPDELTPGQIHQTINEFTDSARNAIDAGFDGVELHGANGYLVHQFLSTNANLRTDEWGGSPHDRIRFAVELTTAVADAIGAARTAIRISPGAPLNDIEEDDYTEIYPLLIESLNPLGLAYLHIMETREPEFTATLRQAWNGVFMLNPATPGSRTGREELQLIEDERTDILSFGALFMANPDLPRRLEIGAPIQEADMSKSYGGDHTGYTDYPTLQS